MILAQLVLDADVFDRWTIDNVKAIVNVTIQHALVMTILAAGRKRQVFENLWAWGKIWEPLKRQIV